MPTMNIKPTIIAVATALFLGGTAFAQEAAVPAAPAPAADTSILGYLTSTSRLTGDWGGYRKILEDNQKLTISGGYYGETMHVAKGGNSTNRGGGSDAHQYSGALSLSLKWQPIEGTEFYAQVYDYVGRGVAVESSAGTYQYLGNWENSFNFLTMYSLWYKQKIGDHFWFQIGKFDPFCTMICDAYGDSLAATIDNVCPSYLWTPNIPYGLYPYTPWNLMAGWKFSDTLELKAITSYNRVDGRTFLGTNLHNHRDGRNDASSEREYGLTSGLQLDWRLKLASLFSESAETAHLTTTVRPGVWYDSSRIAWTDNDGNAKDGAWGAYLYLEQELYKAGGGEDAKRGINLFGMVSTNAPDRMRPAAPVEEYYSAGLVSYGMIPGRTSDKVGASLSRLEFADSKASETLYELYYLCQVTPWAYAKPVLQYIDRPAYADSGHTVVAGLQFGITF